MVRVNQRPSVATAHARSAVPASESATPHQASQAGTAKAGASCRTAAEVIPDPTAIRPRTLFSRNEPASCALGAERAR
jgi:hypothetical protein